MKPHFQQDGITIYRAEALALLATLADESVDLVATDPPYSSGGAFRGDRMQSTRTKYVDGRDQTGFSDFGGDNRDQRAYGYWCALWLAECLRVTKDGGFCCLFTDWRQLPTTTDAIQAGGWVWRGIVPWNKTEAARPRKGCFRNQCEYVVWGSKGSIGTVLGSEGDGVPCLPGFFTRAVAGSEKFHIAGKPPEIVEEIVAICPDGGLVLDPFMGGGTTPVACKRTGRRCIAADWQEENCNITVQRIAQGMLFGNAVGGAA